MKPNTMKMSLCTPLFQHYHYLDANTLQLLPGQASVEAWCREFRIRGPTSPTRRRSAPSTVGTRRVMCAIWCMCLCVCMWNCSLAMRAHCLRNSRFVRLRVCVCVSRGRLNIVYHISLSCVSGWFRCMRLVWYCAVVSSWNGNDGR